MKKTILTFTTVMTLFTAQAKAAWIVGVANLFTTQSEEVNNYAGLTFASAWVLGVILDTTTIFGTIALLDVNATDGSSEAKLVQAVPELQKVQPEIVTDLMAMARNGITQEVDTEQGKVTVGYIPSDVLTSYLAGTGLSMESQAKLTQIFGMAPAQ